MKTHKTLAILVAVFTCCSLAFPAAPRKNVRLQFHKGDSFLTPQVGINSWAVPFGASYEYAVTDNIGVGGGAMAWFWEGASVIIPSVDGAYHFTKLGVDKLDLFAGAGIGFAIYNAGRGVSGSSGLYLSPFVAGRYWLSDKIALSLRLNFGIIGDWSGVGGLFGVAFRL